LQYFRVTTNTVPFVVSPTALIFTNYPPIMLTNGLWFTNTIQGGISNGPGGLPTQFYEFDVATNATNVSFVLDNLDTAGEISYVVKKGLLPGLSVHDYYVVYAPPSVGLPPPFLDPLDLTASSLPVPLSPGAWYLGVFFQVPTTVNYRIRAVEDLSTNGVPTNPPPQVINLQNAAPYTTNTTAPALFFEFTVATNASQAVFDLLPPSSTNAILLVKNGGFPSLTNFDYALTNAGAITVLTNSKVPLAPGNWFMGVFNLSTGNLSYTVEAQEQTASFTINPQVSFTTNGFNLTWASVPGDTYYVQGKTNLTDPGWQNISPPSLPPPLRLPIRFHPRSPFIISASSNSRPNRRPLSSSIPSLW
jgi:hypothetical protein